MRELKPGPYGVGAIVIGGDYQGLGIVRSLGRHGIPTVVIDDERSISRVSRYTSRTLRVDDLRDDNATLRALDRARSTFGLDGWVVFPTRDETVAALSMHRLALSRQFRIATSEWDCVRHAWDKRETYGLAEALGVGMPRTWFPRDEAALAHIDSDGPLVIKPAVKEHFFYQTKAKAWRADTRDDLYRLFRKAADIVEDGEVIIQEMVPGGGDTQYSYCALMRAGVPLASMTARRLRQHPSDFGRASTFVETIDEPLLAEPSLRFLGKIGYSGLVELEYKKDPRNGVFKLLDFNARTWGYHSLGLAAGVDFPWLLFREQLGEEPTPVTARPGVRWIRLLTDLPNAAVDVKARRLRVMDYVRTLRGISTEAVFSLRDPLPGLYEVALLPYLAFARGL